MHGIILQALKAFVVETYGDEAWDAVAAEAAIERTLFVPVSTYPDEYVFEIVGAAAELTGASPGELQYEFGRYIVPSLVDTYGVHVDADWTGLELVEHVERYIHEAVRAKRVSEFASPGIAAERVGEERVLVTCASDRQLCAVARGILDGIADHYDATWTVTEPECMHDGDPRCELLVEATTGAEDPVLSAYGAGATPGPVGE